MIVLKGIMTLQLGFGAPVVEPELHDDIDNDGDDDDVSNVVRYRHRQCGENELLSYSFAQFRAQSTSLAHTGHVETNNSILQK